MRLAQMVDDWNSAIEGRRMWDLPDADDLEVLLDAPLSAESVAEFARLAYKAIHTVEARGLTDLAYRLRGAAHA